MMVATGLTMMGVRDGRKNGGTVLSWEVFGQTPSCGWMLGLLWVVVEHVGEWVGKG
jgi:hypothetical protein